MPRSGLPLLAFASLIAACGPKATPPPQEASAANGVEVEDVSSDGLIATDASLNDSESLSGPGNNL